ncbi:MAG: hypothetical protein KF773_14490 [Deltaproteobacteria bacterium]|nr:hypothetical protein [Deltaproteobacteria bacterium]
MADGACCELRDRMFQAEPPARPAPQVESPSVAQLVPVWHERRPSVGYRLLGRELFAIHHRDGAIGLVRFDGDSGRRKRETLLEVDRNTRVNDVAVGRRWLLLATAVGHQTGAYTEVSELRGFDLNHLAAPAWTKALDQGETVWRVAVHGELGVLMRNPDAGKAHLVGLDSAPAQRAGTPSSPTATTGSSTGCR